MNTKPHCHSEAILEFTLVCQSVLSEGFTSWFVKLGKEVLIFLLSKSTGNVRYRIVFHTEDSNTEVYFD